MIRRKPDREPSTAGQRFPAVPRRRRKGAAVVEMAVVTPIIFMVVFACIECGRLLMAFHGMEAAAREGCRAAVAWDSTTSSVESVVEDRLATFGITNYSLTLVPSSPADACQWELISVRITTDYGSVSWLPSPRFLKNVTLNASCSLPQEADRCSQ